MSIIEYRTLDDHAYERIRQGLVTAVFHRCQVLVIRTLAASYGVSTTPGPGSRPVAKGRPAGTISTRHPDPGGGE